MIRVTRLSPVLCLYEKVYICKFFYFHSLINRVHPFSMRMGNVMGDSLQRSPIPFLGIFILGYLF